MLSLQRVFKTSNLYFGKYCTRFEILTPVALKVQIFWDFTPFQDQDILELCDPDDGGTAFFRKVAVI